MEFKIRRLDNLHIVFWILKDTCWMLEWKAAGSAMIVPTIGVSLILCYSTRKFSNRFYPNVSVLCWILANSTWMMAEFFSIQITGLALFFFICGLINMGYYYGFENGNRLKR